MGLGCPKAPLKCDWNSFRGLSSERVLVLVGALRVTGSGLAIGSTPSIGLAVGRTPGIGLMVMGVPSLGLSDGRTPGIRLAMKGVLGWRAFLVSPDFIILTHPCVAEGLFPSIWR